MLLGFYLFLVIALPLVLGGMVALNGVSRSRTCPGCAGETLRLRSRSHAALSHLMTLVRPEELHLRWCPFCRWKGTARLPHSAVAPVVESSPRPTPARPEPATPQGLEVRRLEIDGEDWRIRLHCWAEGGSWSGRLFFVGPGGRSWADERPCVSGRSALQVLAQVLAFPDTALAGRIRKATR